MTALSRTMILPAALVVAVVGSLWLADPGSGAPAGHGGTPQPHGINIVIKTHDDPNFCVEASPALAGSDASIQECAARDNQHWTFVNADDGSLVLVDGDGNCLDSTSGKKGFVKITACTFGPAERFLFTSSAQIETATGHLCVADAKAASGAALYFVTCRAGDDSQVFALAH